MLLLADRDSGPKILLVGELLNESVGLGLLERDDTPDPKFGPIGEFASALAGELLIERVGLMLLSVNESSEPVLSLAEMLLNENRGLEPL